MDLDYSIWLSRLLTPLTIVFLLPGIIVFLLYFNSLFLYVYKWHRLVTPEFYLAHKLIVDKRPLRPLVDATSFRQSPQTATSGSWPGRSSRPCGMHMPASTTGMDIVPGEVYMYTDFISMNPPISPSLLRHNRLYCVLIAIHRYEVHGMEHLPVNGPALIVYYHGAIPVDIYYLIARVVLERERLIYTVADRFLFKIPGFAIISESCNVSPGTIQSCVSILKEGNLLAISPGGVFEAQFGDNSYELLWRNRIGFAKVALEAQVPIVPMFTENLREAFRSLGLFRRFFLRVYNWTRFPARPLYGGFPVKLRTHLGPPIYVDQSMTPEQVRERVAEGVEELINKHQRIPGSISKALWDRLPFDRCAERRGQRGGRRRKDI